MKKGSQRAGTACRAGLRLVASVEERSLLERLAGNVDEQLGLFAERMREGLLAASVAIGLEVMSELQEAEVIELAGPRGKHDPGRSAYRHGSEAGRVTLGGRRVPIRRPRVRTVDGVEVRLESYDTFASVDLLAEQTVASLLAGLSGRRYQQVLEPVGKAVAREASGVSQSSVSRRFITATAERLAAFRSCPLDGERWLIVFVDGFDFAGHTMVGALGVTADGRKVPLSVVEGSTENTTVVRGLITGLRDRGLDACEGVLFVIDGAKAVAKAIRQVFDEQAVIARCRVHKQRNVLDHLPDVERLWVRRKLQAAWANPDASEAEAALTALAGQLAKVNPDAAASLREGLADTLTVTRLGITGSLLKTVMSTNPMESMIEIVRDHARNVKHWQHGDMRLRWAAAGMLAAATQFRRVKGFRQLPALAAALKREITATEEAAIVQAA